MPSALGTRGDAGRSRFVGTVWPFLLISFALSFLSPLIAHAGSFAVFGPTRYVRDTGKPFTVSSNFTVLGPTAPYTLRIENSDVASAVVVLNGVLILGPSDLNINVTTLS